MAFLSPTAQASTGTPLRRPPALDAGLWAILIGSAALAFPTLASLNDQTWSQESGSHGPIILATGAWLLWREKARFVAEARPGNLALTLVAMAIGLAVHAIGQAVDLITLDAAGLYIVGLAIAYGTLGPRLMLRTWFPFAYLAFAVPPPSVWLNALTLPLKGLVSAAATDLLSAVGLPVSREGVTIYVAQYQLLVEDACSGMNSLVGLTAIGLLYVYLRRGSSLARSVVLSLFIIPIAIAANILRIVTIILLTYFFGDDVAQGILHPTAGLLLFAVALAMIFGIDELLERLRARKGSKS